MVRLSTLVGVALLGATLLLGCAAPEHPTSMTGDKGEGPTGHWIQRSGDQETRAIFYADGELSWVDNRGDQSGRWASLSPTTIELDLGTSKSEAEFTRSADSLNLTLKPDGPTFRFTKE